MSFVIEVDNLKKSYGSFVAVDGISFNVQKGEIFGVAGPNGAGKSSLVETVIGLRERDGGRVTVLGLDPEMQRGALAERIGIQLQSAELPQRIRVWEALDLYSSFYNKTTPWEPLLETWGLSEKKNSYFGDLSGGQKQRLFIALALINDPEIVVLDELTTGLDPQARRQTWELVSAIREQGKTVVQVTHFMDEAEALCDRICIIDGGKIIALDTPRNLIRSMAADNRVVFETSAVLDLQTLEQLPTISSVVKSGRRVIVQGSAENLVSLVVNHLDSQQIHYDNLRTEQSNLEDVFISLTGRALRA